MHSQTITKIIRALIFARGQFKTAAKSATNPHFKSKYVPLEGVVDAITDALLANDIFATQKTRISDAGDTVLVTQFYHVSGEWIASEYPVHPVKPDPQALGSAMTYARRYSLMALAGIPAEDDDGNAATANVRPSAKVTPTDGAWEAQSAESQAFLLKLAVEVTRLFETEGGNAAADHLSAQGLEADEKAAVWTRLDSPVRTAIKKAMKEKVND